MVEREHQDNSSLVNGKVRANSNASQAACSGDGGPNHRHSLMAAAATVVSTAVCSVQCALHMRQSKTCL